MVGFFGVFLWFFFLFFLGTMSGFMVTLVVLHKGK